MPRCMVLACGLLFLATGCGEMVSESDAEDRPTMISPFDGDYVLADDRFGEGDSELGDLTSGILSPLRVRGEILRYGELIVGELRLTRPTWQGNVLHSPACWHEDIHDPGDMTEVQVELKQKGGKLVLTIDDAGDETVLVYQRKTS